jgi:hypothetical protein
MINKEQNITVLYRIQINCVGRARGSGVHAGLSARAEAKIWLGSTDPNNFFKINNKLLFIIKSTPTL